MKIKILNSNYFEQLLKVTRSCIKNKMYELTKEFKEFQFPLHKELKESMIMYNDNEQW